MFCEVCGAKNRNDSKFCNNCGNELTPYTKKVTEEELVMPDKVESEKVVITKNSKLKKILDISMLCLLVLAILFTCLSFAISSATLGLILTSMVFYGLLFGVWIFTKNYFKKPKKKKKQQ